MLLFSEQEFAAGGHGNLHAESLVMVTPRQATSRLFLHMLTSPDKTRSLKVSI